MKKLKQIIQVILLSVVTSGMIHASTDSTRVHLSVGADVVNHYVWRGLMLGNSPAIQPVMQVSAGNLSFGSWASYSISPSSFQEVDLFLNYSIGNLSIGLTDYYNPVDSLWKGDYYFKVNRSSTLHTIESSLTYSEIGGTGFSATAGVMLFGNDRDEDGSNFYSNYFELSYAANVNDYGLNLFAGATFSKGYYAEKASLVNIGACISREVKISESFTIPVKGSFIVNPEKQNVYLVFGFTF
jgi:hypothetical protein